MRRHTGALLEEGLLRAQTRQRRRRRGNRARYVVDRDRQLAHASDFTFRTESNQTYKQRAMKNASETSCDTLPVS